MIHTTRLSSVLLVAVALTSACRSEVPADAGTVAVAVAVATEGVPKIAADEPVHDLGAIKATDSVEHVFKMRNVGDADLEVERVQKT